MKNNLYLSKFLELQGGCNVAQRDAFVYALGRAIAKNELDEKLSPTRTVQRKKI